MHPVQRVLRHAARPALPLCLRTRSLRVPLLPLLADSAEVGVLRDLLSALPLAVDDRTPPLVLSVLDDAAHTRGVVNVCL